MGEIDEILSALGPSRSSLIAERLQEQYGLTADTARKRLSRVARPIVRFPIPLLPKREAFLYRLLDRNTERFWTNLHRDLRATNSVFGAALDGVLARGGSVCKADFAVVSGAPIAQKGHISADHVASRMVEAGLLKAIDFPENQYMAIGKPIGTTSLTARVLTEEIILDAICEWAKRLA